MATLLNTLFALITATKTIQLKQEENPDKTERAARLEFEPTYDLVVKGLTSTDLRNSRLPNNHFNIWLDVSLAGRNYEMIYSADSKSSKEYFPRVSLVAHAIPLKEFEGIEKMVRLANRGKKIPSRPIYQDHGGETSALIHEGLCGFDQKFIAHMVDSFAINFKAYTLITRAYYDEVPESLVISPGFSTDKIKSNDSTRPLPTRKVA